MGCVFSIKIIHPEENQEKEEKNEKKNEEKNMLENESDEDSYNIVFFKEDNEKYIIQ